LGGLRGAPLDEDSYDTDDRVDIEFERPQPGPMLLGWGSHFGLGQFEAV
jgi:hypothetical protein